MKINYNFEYKQIFFLTIEKNERYGSFTYNARYEEGERVHL